MRQFSILFFGRSGSSYLRSALNNHSEIYCASEAQFAPANRDIVDLNQDLHPFVVSGYSGIKVPLQLVDGYPLDHGFWETNVWHRPIIICTRNPLRRYISFSLVRGNDYSWTKIAYSKPVHINISEARRFVMWSLRTLRLFVKLKGLQVLILRYEDGVDVCYSRALEFLGVNYEPPESYLTKQTTLPLEELIINYDELYTSNLGYLLKCDNVSLEDLCSIYCN